MRVTNLTEFFWDREIEALLRMCGEEERFIGAQASDYDRFWALCRSAHLLQGHSFLQRLSWCMEHLFQIPLLLSAENAERIWKETSESFLFGDFSKVYWDEIEIENNDEPLLAEPVKLDHSCFVDGNLLLNTNASDWEAWKDEMNRQYFPSLNPTQEGIFLRLPKDFCFQTPNTYQVGLSLQKNCKTRADESLLYAQLFRFLSEMCSQTERRLLLRVECDLTQALRLLSYVEKQVGLPELIWNLAPYLELSPWLRLYERPRQHPLECAICRDDYSGKQEWNVALREYAKQYPMGKLLVF